MVFLAKSFSNPGVALTKIFREWAYNQFHFPGKSEAKNAGGGYSRNIEKKRGMCDEKNEMMGLVKGVKF